jgi:hypothetical protein
MASIESLSWDSNFFEKRIGKVIIHDENIFDPIVFLHEAKQNFDLVYVLSYQKMLIFENVLSANLDLMDIMITMSMQFNKDLFADKDYEFKNTLTKAEIVDCYEIAEQTSKVSRFYNEPMIGPEKAKALYRKWVDNAVNTSFSDGILLYKTLDAINGIHIIKTDPISKIGYCSLIGVNAKVKGKGIGKNLWAQAFGYWTAQNNISKCIVPFSLKNSESFNFHLKIGFNKIEEIKYIYHYRNILNK